MGGTKYSFFGLMAFGLLVMPLLAQARAVPTHHERDAKEDNEEAYQVEKANEEILADEAEGEEQGTGEAEPDVQPREEEEGTAGEAEPEVEPREEDAAEEEPEPTAESEEEDDDEGEAEPEVQPKEEDAAEEEPESTADAEEEQEEDEGEAEPEGEPREEDTVEREPEPEAEAEAEVAHEEPDHQDPVDEEAHHVGDEDESESESSSSSEESEVNFKEDHDNKQEGHNEIDAPGHHDGHPCAHVGDCSIDVYLSEVGALPAGQEPFLTLEGMQEHTGPMVSDMWLKIFGSQYPMDPLEMENRRRGRPSPKVRPPTGFQAVRGK